MPYSSNGQDTSLPNWSLGFNSPVRLPSAAIISGDAPDSYSGEQSSSLWRRTRFYGEWCNQATHLVLTQKSPGSNPGSPAWPPRTAAAPLSYCGRPGSAPGGGSMCSYSNSGREGGLRSRQLRVRLPPSTPARPLWCVCRTSPIGRGASFRARRIAVRVRGSALWKVNRPGCRAPLLAGARVTSWLSSSPPSSEDEPARWLAPAGNRVAANDGEFRVLRPLPSPACSHRAGEQFVSWRVNLPGSQAPPRKRLDV